MGVGGYGGWRLACIAPPIRHIRTPHYASRHDVAHASYAYPQHVPTYQKVFTIVFSTLLALVPAPTY